MCRTGTVAYYKQLGETYRGAQFPEQGTALGRSLYGEPKGGLGSVFFVWTLTQQQFALQPMQFRLEPAFAGLLCHIDPRIQMNVRIRQIAGGLTSAGQQRSIVG